MLKVEWATGVGYGDFVTGLGYAHTSAIKYNLPVTINFHWAHSKDFLYHKNDPETIVDRCNYIYSIMKYSPMVEVKHTFNSDPDFRFINQLDEFNPLHGLWYSILEPSTTNKVVLWTTRHNIDFPGEYKDPAFKYWDDIVSKLEKNGLEVVEVTYRTPVKEVIQHINECIFGIGYDGLVHQIFKFMWKPLIVFCKRIWLNGILVPQACLIEDPTTFLNTDLKYFVNKSKRNIDRLLIEHKDYMNEFRNARESKFYNTPIYRSRSYRS